MITGGCGFHYYYRRPEGLDLSLPIIAENIVRSGGVPPLGVGVDIPSYLVAPPSRHFTGGVYQWKVDGDPYQVPLGDAPGWMVERLTKTATKEKTRVATVPVEWAKLTDEAITEYHDAYAAKVAGKLVRAISLDPAFARGLLRAWNQTYCHPPLSDHELNQIFDRVATREAERLERINEGRAAGQ